MKEMAEYFSAELSQKVKRGMALTAQKGLFTGSIPALGYKIVDKKFAIDEDTAPLVKRIFEMYLSGSTMVNIIRYLTENGIKTHRGNTYHKDTIRRILSNDKYLGIYKYDDVVIHDGIPQIIDNTTFEEVQMLLEKNRKAPARTKAVDENYLLTTKIFCGHCNCAMTGVSGTSSTGKIHQYYACVTQKRRGGCKKKSVQKAYIEDLVVGEVLAVLNDEYIDN